jgi:hypothetical protein
VPSEAIIFNRDGLSVAIVENGAARNRQVNVVRDFGTTAEVSAGIKEGDRVILNPPVNLTDGRKIQVRSAPLAKPSQAVIAHARRGFGPFSIPHGAVCATMSSRSSHFCSFRTERLQ